MALSFRSLFFILFLVSPISTYAADSDANDAYLRGYIASALEGQLGWKPGSFKVEVKERVATVVMEVDDPERRERAERILAHIEGVDQIHIVVATDAPPPVNTRVLFPVGDLFRPLVADPKQPQFFVSY